MQDNKSYYDEFSAWYEKKRHKGYHALIDDLQFELVSEDASGADVLEIGCGTGLILQRVHEIARTAKGVDISPGMLEKAKERGLDVVEGSVTNLPFQDDSFDLVYSFKVLAHVKEIDQALSEAIRVVRPGGLLILDFYNRQSLRYLAKKLAGPGKISDNTHEDALFTRWETPSETIARLPSSVKLIAGYGVRIVTPFAAIYKVPVLSTFLGKTERIMRDMKTFSKYGGFYVVKLQKR